MSEYRLLKLPDGEYVLQRGYEFSKQDAAGAYRTGITWVNVVTLHPTWAEWMPEDDKRVTT